MPFVGLTVDQSDIDAFPVDRIQEEVAAVTSRHLSMIPERQLRHYTDVSIIPTHCSSEAAYYVKVFF